ncbi:DedA family protein [Aestuariicoccus sp. MJ-SS9]|uniref:DedA family protein n=1 Tax=Aestuariicoccus sp. MJ-SS9 TaxID=3079855 RepID=UPI00290729D1|nr:VTT domain-containing protein [Aestuariicoccus sp. MJ-SS9]MDU8913027.1 VTT domain-containing protein [Aestuariicoccus sp. MJ-SS9]
MTLTETALSLVPVYGPVALLTVTFLSCLALPVPSSLMMLTGGAFVASGDLEALSVVAAALGGSVLGDQAGFAIGRRGSGLLARLGRDPKRAKMLDRARSRLHARAATTVFLTRWLFSPLGPYVNFAGGAAGLGWARFSLASVLGESVWVTLYIGLGAAFASQLEALSDMLGAVSGLLVALLLTVLSGRALLHRLKAQGATPPRP